MSWKRKNGTFRQRENNKKLLVVAGSVCQNIVSMFKKIKNNLMKSVVSTF
jgi:hypothetical protein